MRESLKRSIAQSPAKGFEDYPKGSIVLCNACSLPIYRLDRGINLGDGLGRAANAFKPCALVDLSFLMERDDVDAGVRALLRTMGPEGRLAHIQKLREVRAGDPAVCPVCNRGFMQVRSVDPHEVLDRAYTVEMLTIPPAGRATPQSGKRLGFDKDWVH